VDRTNLASRHGRQRGVLRVMRPPPRISISKTSIERDLSKPKSLFCSGHRAKSEEGMESISVLNHCNGIRKRCLIHSAHSHIVASGSQKRQQEIIAASHESVSAFRPRDADFFAKARFRSSLRGMGCLMAFQRQFMCTTLYKFKFSILSVVRNTDAVRTGIVVRIPATLHNSREHQRERGTHATQSPQCCPRPLSVLTRFLPRVMPPNVFLPQAA
jgi:hypothetical protein